MAIPAGRPDSSGKDLLVGVERGGTKCICILATGPDRVLCVERFATGMPDETLPIIAACIADWQSKADVAAVGIASFGPLELDPQAARFGTVTTTPKPGWTGSDLKPIADGLPYSIDTDVNGAALAEGLWGAARGLDSWSYITLGTGLGVASIVGGKPVVGLGHSEAGHMRVPVANTAFGGVCPFHGNCVEGMISGPALSAWSGIDAEEISDDDAIWGHAASILAYLCHNLLLTAVPQKIVIGGGIAVKRPFLLDRAREKLAESLGGYAHSQKLGSDMSDFLMPAKLGEMAGPLGAIALAKSRTAQSG